MASRWRTLSVPDVATWETENANYPRTDSLGNPYTITGQALQMSSNVNNINSQLAILNAIPAFVAFPVITNFDAQVNVAGITEIFVVTPAIVPAGYKLMIYATLPGMTAITSFDFNKMFLIGTRPAGANTSLNIFPFYTSRFPFVDTLSGTFFLTACRYVNINTGQQGAIQFGLGTII